MSFEPGYEWSNFGWEGQNETAVLQNVTDALALGLPLDIATMQNYEGNDIANGSGSVGSISGNTLTVTTANSGFSVGQYIYLPGITPGTYITAPGTGTGGVGTYTVNISQTVASGSLSNTVPLTTAIINSVRWKSGLIYNRLVAAGITPIVTTSIPSNDVQKTFGPADALRRGLDIDWRGIARKGVLVGDLNAAIQGLDNGAGQYQFKVGMTNDGAHPNDAGNALLWPIIQRAISRVVQPSTGVLINSLDWRDLPRIPANDNTATERRMVG